MGHPCNGTLCSLSDDPVTDVERCLPYMDSVKSQFVKIIEQQNDPIIVRK